MLPRYTQGAVKFFGLQMGADTFRTITDPELSLEHQDLYHHGSGARVGKHVSAASSLDDGLGYALKHGDDGETRYEADKGASKK